MAFSFLRCSLLLLSLSLSLSLSLIRCSWPTIYYLVIILPSRLLPSLEVQCLPDPSISYNPLTSYTMHPWLQATSDTSPTSLFTDTLYLRHERSALSSQLALLRPNPLTTSMFRLPITCIAQSILERYRLLYHPHLHSISTSIFVAIVVFKLCHHPSMPLYATLHCP